LKALLQNINYDVNDGWTISEFRDETFDIATITIVTTTKMPFPFNIPIVLDDENGFIKKMITRLDTSILSSKNPDIYTHTIQLIEYTFLLTLQATPTIVFRERLNDKIHYNSVFGMIVWAIQVTFTELQNNPRQFSLMPMQILLDLDSFELIAPESNLHIVLNLILSKYNFKIVLLSSNELLAVSLNEVNNTIQIEEFDSFQAINHANESGTSYKMNIKNAINERIQSNYDPFGDFEVPDSEDSEYKESKLLIRTKYPISKVLKFTIVRYGNSLGQGDNIDGVSGDASNLVIEKSEYDASSIANNKKQNIIYFTYGTNEIRALGMDWQTIFGFGGITWKEMYRTTNASIPNSFKRIGYSINYETILDDLTIKIGKENIQGKPFQTTIQSTQTENIVNIQSIGNRIYNDVQGSGNKRITYRIALNKNISSMFNLGDFDELTNSVVTNRVFDGTTNNGITNHSVTYDLDEFYPQLTGNIDLQAEIRQSEIPKRNEALRSYRNYDDYVEWTFNDSPPVHQTLLTDLGIKVFAGNFDLVNRASSDSILLSFLFKNPDRTDKSDILIPCVNFFYQGVIGWHFNFDSPVISAYKKQQTQLDSELPNLLDEVLGVAYADENGFLEELGIGIGSQIKNRNINVMRKLPEISSTDQDNSKIIINTDFFRGSSGAVEIEVTNSVIADDIVNAIFEANISNKFINETNVIININTFDPILISFRFKIEVRTTSEGFYKVAYNQLIGIGNINVDVNIFDTLNSIKYTLTGSYSGSEIEVNFTKINIKYQQQNDPVAPISNLITIAKSSNEILHFNYLLHNYPTTNINTEGEIILGERFFSNNYLQNGFRTHIFKQSTERFQKHERFEGKGTIITASLSYNFTNDSTTISTNLTDPTINSWCVTDTNNRLIFAVNRSLDGSQLPTRIFFRFFHRRNNVLHLFTTERN
jgi:hypothetical protein